MHNAKIDARTDAAETVLLLHYPGGADRANPEAAGPHAIPAALVASIGRVEQWRRFEVG